MTKKLTKYEENRNVAESKITQQLMTASISSEKDRALVMIGAVSAVNQIAAILSSQTMRGLQHIRDEKVFESLGFTRFDDFLNESEYSPMSYRQFIDREKLLANEGDQLFDVLNTMKMSHKQRRLLGAGNVKIDEENGTVIVTTTVGPGDVSATRTEEIELSDRTRLLQTLSALADQNALLNDKTNKQKIKIERGEQDVIDLKKQLDEAKNRPGERSAEQLLFDQFMRVVNSIDALAVTVKEMPLVQKMQHEEVYLNSIQAAIGRLEAAYGRKTLGEMNEVDIKKHVAKRLKKISVPEDEEPTPADEELADLME